MRVFQQFFRSFQRLDRKFFLQWLIDIIFFVSVGVIYHLSMFRFGNITAKLDALNQQALSDAVVQELYRQIYVYLGTLLVMALIILIVYIIVQAALWNLLMPARLSWKFLLRFGAYLLVTMPLVLSGAFIATVLAVSVLSMAAALTGVVAFMTGFVIATALYSLLLPAVIFPSYAFFKQQRVWQGLGYMFYSLFETLPKLWPHYLLAGLVMAVVTQLFHFFTGLSQAYGGWVLTGLIVAPALAWYRPYILGMIQKSH